MITSADMIEAPWSSLNVETARGDMSFEGFSPPFLASAAKQMSLQVSTGNSKGKALSDKVQ